MDNRQLTSLTRTGIYLALATALISGVSIYLNKFAVRAVSDVLLFTTLKNTLVGALLIIYLARTGVRIRGGYLRATHWAGLCGLALVGGSLPFLLFFQGLAQASAPSAALIHKSLFLWVALLAAPLLGERLGRWALAGLGLLAAGQLLNGWPKSWGWGGGENLILVATLLWAVETIVAKRLLPALSASLAAAARMAGGAVVMWAYLLATGQANGLTSLTAVQWGWVALTSALLLGYVTTWYAALKRAPATVVTSVLTLGAVITSLLGLALEGSRMPSAQAAGLMLMAAGVVVMVGLLLRRRRDAPLAAA
jgi:drug/metabolite transporter (DMT)-like permease